MADTTFNTPAGQTVDRELLIACLNTGETGKNAISGFDRSSISTVSARI